METIRKEIGSEFWDIPICDKENSLFPPETKWLLSGRTALELIVKDSGIKSISMPKWCCDSMILPFVKNNVMVDFYDKVPNEDLDAVFLIDYFGFSSNLGVSKSYKGIVIRDITHSIFSKVYDDADYYFGSLRKWAGFLTGGFAWGKWKRNIEILPCDEQYVLLRKRAMDLKKSFINGTSSSKTYLELFRKASERLNKCGLCSAYDADILSAKHLNITRIKKVRRKNAGILIDRIGCIYHMSNNDCPLFVPITVKNRDLLRNFLIENNVYLPIHWPNSDLNGTELSLVCDQRYDEEDMKYMCDLIDRFYNQESVSL